MRIGFTWLDAKLAARMLVKHPGLSIVCGLAAAFAIATGTVFFELLTQAIHPSLPLDEPDRVVGLRLWDAERQSVEGRAAHDFTRWREELAMIESLGAFRNAQRNLAVEGRAAIPLPFAEIDAAAFAVARVAPLLGRGITKPDLAPAAPAVVVLAERVWRQHLGGDPRAIGTAVRIDGTPHVVVGVMPAGFEYPFAQEAWVPLAVDPHAHAPRAGPGVQLVARLAPGASLADARAELAAAGRRAATEWPATHAHLRPELMPYAEAMFPVRVGFAVRAGAWSINLALVMFLLLVFANVAMLIFARAASREAELVVRDALGASRGRIVLQLFAEALALGAIAAAIGLVAAQLGVGYAISLLEIQLGSGLPFWFHAGLAPRTVAYALALTVLGAAVSGVLPALKVTGARRAANLGQRSAGAGGLRFGGVWTAVIVAQVALTVAFPVTVRTALREIEDVATLEAGMDSARYLTARVEIARHEASGAPIAPERIARLRAALEHALEAEPGVAGATYGTQLPRMYHPWRRIVVDAPDGAADAAAPAHRVGGAAVAADYFETLGTPLVEGRSFAASDDATHSIVVNRRFVETILGGQPAIGRRLRYVASDEPRAVEAARRGTWYEIVGVAPDLAVGESRERRGGAALYHPLTPQATTDTDRLGDASTHLAVRLGGDPAAFAPRLHAIANAVDPGIRLYEVKPMDAIPAATLRLLRFWLALLVGTSVLALALSLAGIYAVTSFTVVRRTREIGIRLALGAEPRRIVAAVFAAPLGQIGIGLALGAALAGFLALSMEGGWRNATPSSVAGFVTYALVMLAICLAACAGPTRRALRIEPTEALREDG